MDRFLKRFLVALLFSTAVAGYGQAPNEYENSIRRIMNTGLIQGWDEKLINGTDDVAAVSIIKLLGGEPIRPEVVPRILQILNDAFVAESKNPDDRAPRAALFLLNSLRQSVNDPTIRAQILESRERLLIFAKTHYY